MPRTLLLVTAVAAFVGACAALRADTIRLTNGDTVRGKVVAIDGKQVTIESESFGKLVVQRDKIANITLGEAPAAAPPAAAPGGAASGPLPDVKIDPKKDKPEDIIRKLVPKNFDMKKLSELSKGAKQAANPEDVVRQLREAGGVDPSLQRMLESQIPGFTSPQVHAYFDKQVNGLMSGEISLGDIRNDALDTRDQLQALKKDLGPSGAALDGYLGILNGFINDTASVPAKKPRKKKPQVPGGNAPNRK